MIVGSPRTSASKMEAENLLPCKHPRGRSSFTFHSSAIRRLGRFCRVDPVLRNGMTSELKVPSKRPYSDRIRRMANPQSNASKFLQSSQVVEVKVFVRSICLVQFEQRSGDDFVVRFRLVCDSGLAFWLTVHTVHFSRNWVISGGKYGNRRRSGQ